MLRASRTSVVNHWPISALLLSDFLALYMKKSSTVQMWSLEDMKELGLFPSLCRTWGLTQHVSLGRKHFYPQSQLWLNYHLENLPVIVWNISLQNIMANGDKFWGRNNLAFSLLLTFPGHQELSAAELLSALSSLGALQAETLWVTPQALILGNCSYSLSSPPLIHCQCMVPSPLC